MPLLRFSGVDHYGEVKRIAEFLRTKTSQEPKIGVVCGSGLGGLADKLDQATVIEYKDIPGFKQSTGEDCFEGAT